MYKVFLLLILLEIRLSIKPVYLQFANEDLTQTQNVNMYWDFSFNRICVSEGQIDCSKIFCKLQQKNFQYYYHDIQYQADVYQMNVVIEDEDKQKVLIQLDVDFVTQGDCLALGLGPNSALKDALNGKTLKIDPFSSNLQFVNQEPDVLYDLDIKKEIDFNKESGFILDSCLSYKAEIDIIEINEMVNNSVEFCLNPKSYIGRRNYFFQVIGNFVEDWEENRRKFENYILQLFIRDMSFSLQNDDQGYTIPYDLDLFKAYGGYPMKNMEGDRIPSCEGYVGDYFYERSENGQSLKARFDIDIQPYRFAAYWVYKIILFTIWIGLFLYLIYLSRQQQKRKAFNSNDNQEYITI